MSNQRTFSSFQVYLLNPPTGPRLTNRLYPVMIITDFSVKVSRDEKFFLERVITDFFCSSMCLVNSFTDVLVCFFTQIPIVATGGKAGYLALLNTYMYFTYKSNC